MTMTTLAALATARPPAALDVRDFLGGEVYFVLALAALNLALVYQMWRQLDAGEHARYSPALASGMLLVPGVNLVWIFIAFVTWARDYNVTLAAYGIDAPPVRERTMWAYALATVVPVPVLSQIVQVWGIATIWRAMRRLQRSERAMRDVTS